MEQAPAYALLERQCRARGLRITARIACEPGSPLVECRADLYDRRLEEKR